MKAPEVKAFADLLEGRIKTLEKRADELDKKLDRLGEAHNDLRLALEVNQALLKREVEDLKKWKDEQKKDRDEKARRLWSFGPNIAGAIATALLSVFISIATILIVSYFGRSHP